MTDKLTRDEGIVHAAVIATMQCLRLRSEVDFEAAREAVKFALGLPEIRSALAGEAKQADSKASIAVAQAPSESKPCAFCGNENIGVEVSDQGFSVFCGFFACNARGPIRRGQMDAVEAWNGIRRVSTDPVGTPRPMLADIGREIEGE